MRPIQLTMTAFGPFALTEQIQFERLGDNPLFLINGPTGSGKTTILDAICFALYGKTTGDERQATQMRCDHADSSHIARVELIYKLGDCRYRIAREPDQLRPKVRGEGFTRHAARAELYRIDANGEESLLVAAKVTEANSAVEAMTGLNVEQFRQVMVLPQGQFRRLLMADSADRQKVFGQLFQTHIYKRIEYALKEQSADLRSRLEALRNQQKGILDSADLPDETTLAEQQALLVAQVTEALATKNAAHTALDAAKAQAATAQKLAQDFDRLALEQGRLEQLNAQSAAIAEQKQSLDQARLAARLNPDYERLQHARQTLETSQGRAEQAAQRFAEAELCRQQSQAALQQALSGEAEIDALRQQKIHLQAYQQRVANLTQARQLQREKSADLHRAEQSQQRHQHDWQAAEQAQRGVAQALAEVAATLKTLPAEQARLMHLQQQFKDRQRLGKLHQQVADCLQAQRQSQAELTSAAERFEGCLRTEQQLELRWHQGQAALLAEQLNPGEPCVVCGSTEHPQPAQTSTDMPSQQQRTDAKAAVENARADQQAIDNVLSALRATGQQLNSSVAALEAELGAVAGGTIEALQQAHNAQQQTVDDLLNTQAREQQLHTQLVQAEQHRDECRGTLAEAEQAAAQARTDAEVARQALVTAEAEIPEAYRAEGELANQLVTLEQRLNQLLTTLQTARERCEQDRLHCEKWQAHVHSAEQSNREAEQAVAAAERRWQTALTATAFTSQAAFLQALQSDDQISALQQALEQHATALAAVKGAITGLQSALQDTAQPDLAAIERQVIEAEQVWLQANETHNGLDKRLSTLHDVDSKLQQARQKAAGIEQQYAVIGTLSDVANGKTDHHISLERFVLSVLLDDVLIEASQRLNRMSKGRYQLYRQQQKGRGNAASGLELLVDDAYSGKQRPVATLSGGESFMAALSLALGLSDVVQAYAGGIRLDTLFVDEGFGSLDPESLDLAVNTLIDLQASGRMVGVISHVPELKERINIRLDVHSSRTGSTTRLVLA